MQLWVQMVLVSQLLANVVMGNPVYEISKGNIIFEGEDITEEPVDNRAKLGMFLSFSISRIYTRSNNC